MRQRGYIECRVAGPSSPWPEVEHEKYALAELLSRGIPYVWPGPDIWSSSKDRWPEIFTVPDQVHLNKLGDGVDATLWHELLQRYDRGELEQTLESAWGDDWARSRYLSTTAETSGTGR